MKEKIKYFNVLQIVSNISLIVLLIPLIVTKEKFIFNLFWLVILILILGTVWFTAKWGKRGTDTEVKKSKEVARSFDDITTILLVLYGLVYLGIEIMTYFVDTVKVNIYVAIGFYVFSIVVQLFMFVAVDNAVKNSIKIIEDIHNKK
ncbi:MAG: hypothetical protein PHR09_01510 [Bacilli bacterium]|nr:hypothetical protein [Bacilli bacterium]